MTTARAGILFDVDGTLVDSNYLHTLAWSRALTDVGEWAPMNAIHRLIGTGGAEFTQRLLGHPEPRANEIQTERYQELQAEARLFPGARDLLIHLHRHGLRVILATSSPRVLLEGAMELLDVGDAIAAATSADDVASPKPAPDVFQSAIEIGGLARDCCLALGDSIWDVEAAQAAGVACIGVESGGFSRHELVEAGAVAVYRDVLQLLEQWRTSPLSMLASALG